jgi:hypothetical protein
MAAFASSIRAVLAEGFLRKALPADLPDRMQCRHETHHKESNMNPETGNIERVMGTTADNLEVFASSGLRLKFTLLTCEWIGWSVIFALWFDFQKNEFDKRRPSICVSVLGFMFQSGWLFG